MAAKNLIVLFFITKLSLSDGAGEGYGLAQDADGVHILVPVDQGLVHGVLRFQNDVVIKEPDTLEGGLGADEDGGDLAIVHGFLLADVDDVAIKDPGIDHGVTFAGEGKVGPDVAGKVNIVLDMLLSQDGSAAGNGADQRDLAHFGHGDDVGGEGVFICLPSH